ncbi:uncharacterized protein [Arachis hypogaea]|uniref:uncharacterized protein n=1 Tax=Arachis hypogaea TaxID=3818 RepID=UPI003B223928
MNLSVKEAIVLPPARQIILEFNTKLQLIGQATGLLNGSLGSLGADFQHFPINEESWKTMDITLKKHAYNTVKQKHRQNALNRSKQLYSHTEKLQQRRIDRGEIWAMAHLKKDGSYMNDDAHIVGEVITNIERDGSLKEISLSDSLVQVLGKDEFGG